ncbi:hypothetical protein M3Y96_00715200 [Aphelenchoides besseyi]|nr:hypothetical protein M3Y96_00715200 [Aphelenchoides besseyi]
MFRLKQSTAYVGTCVGKQIVYRAFEHQQLKSGDNPHAKTFPSNEYKIIEVLQVTTASKSPLFVNTAKAEVSAEEVLLEQKNEFYKKGTEASTSHNAPLNRLYRHVRRIIPNITQQHKNEVIYQWQQALVHGIAMELPTTKRKYTFRLQCDGAVGNYTSRLPSRFAFHMHTKHHCYLDSKTLESISQMWKSSIQLSGQ